MPNKEPFYGLRAGLDKSDEVLNMLTKLPNDGIAFGIKGSDITLIPYYMTGSRESGPRTYFKYGLH